jgi:tetratricopeptide (TPR) repeat protein
VVWYWLGIALAAAGKASDAREAWDAAVEEGRAASGPPSVYAAAALQELGKEAEGEKLLADTADTANEQEASAHAFYTAGLAEGFLHHEQAAQKHFRRALELDLLLWEARFELNRSLGTQK